MKNSQIMNRRKFLNTGSKAAAGIMIAGSILPGNVLGANDRLIVAVVGVNNRGRFLAAEFARQGAEIKYVCDVDERTIEKTITTLKEIQQRKPKTETDFRKALDDKEVDVVVIATPDHWHAPMAIMAMQAGKHVYVEKPCSHNPREGELLTQAQKKYKRIVQMGNQQRSSNESIEIIKEIHNGIIGRAYHGRAWYSNSRGSIGYGKPAPVPDELDYDLWQGPAPRTPYRDNIIHYNWHWFWQWGTGESNNNGAHEIDICRWALDADYPQRVVSTGGRFHFNDDWEAFDTQNASFEFEGGKSISWEGRSCNRFPIMNRGRGSSIHGTEGTVVLDRNGYILYDKKNEIIKTVSAKGKSETMGTTGGGSLVGLHIKNFIETITKSGRPNSPIHEGHKSVLLCHLANIAQRLKRDLHCDPGNGHIINDADAMKLWSREYEPGWEPKV